MKKINGLEAIYLIRQLAELDHPLPKDLDIVHQRLLAYALCIGEFGCITLDQAKLIPLFLNTKPLTSESVRVRTYQELKNPYFKESKVSFASVSSVIPVYQLTNKGLDYVTDSMDVLLQILGLESQFSFDIDEFRKHYLSCSRDLTLSNHTIMTNTQSIIAVFQAPLTDAGAIEYERECSIDSYVSVHQSHYRDSNTLVPDFTIRLTPHNDLIAMEVDLDTERMERLMEKIVRYDRIYNHMNVDPVFLLDPVGSLRLGTTEDSHDYEREQELYKIKEARQLTDLEINTLLLLLDTFTLNASEEATLEDFHSYVTQKATVLTVVKKAGWYNILSYIYDYLDGTEMQDYKVPEFRRGKTLIRDLSGIISTLKADAPKKMAALTTLQDDSLLRRKRKALFENIRQLISEKLMHANVSGVLSGMTICATFQKRFWDNFCYLYPLTNLYTEDVVRFRHMGLYAQDNSIFRCRPQKLNADGYSLTLKNVVKYGEYWVAFENVSEDIGGLLRVLYYLNAPYNRYKDLLLVALIGNDLVLANGQSLTSKTVIDYQLDTAAEGSVGYEVKKEIANLGGSRENLRIDLQNGAGLAFMTYRDFENSYHIPVKPFYMITGNGNRKTIGCTFT